jgi:hypothetical protein
MKRNPNNLIQAWQQTPTAYFIRRNKAFFQVRFVWPSPQPYAVLCWLLLLFPILLLPTKTARMVGFWIWLGLFIIMEALVSLALMGKDKKKR